MIDGKHLPAASGTNLLVVDAALLGSKLVVEAQLFENRFQIIDMHAGRKRSVTASTPRLSTSSPLFLVEGNTECDQALEHMEKFSKRDVDEQCQYGEHVYKGHEAVTMT